MQAFRTIVLALAIVGVTGRLAVAETPTPPQTPPPATQGQQPPPKPTPTPTPTATPAAEPGYVETVTVVSATKAEQKLVNAPATMTVIGARALEVAPSNNYADLLRAVPGVNITQLSARDINITSRAATSSLATSQLAILDGRTLYQDFFGFVMWDFMPSNLNEIKQIEVIRGPASAVWGANALNGVINVITKTPREMQGTSFLLGAGSFGREYDPEPGSPVLASQLRSGSLVYGNITHAQAINDQWAYKLSVGTYQSDAFVRPSGLIRGNSLGTQYPTYKNTGTAQPKVDLRLDYDGSNGQRWVFSGGTAGTDGIMHSGIGPFDIRQGTTFSYGKVNYSKNALRVQAFMNALNGDATNLVAVDTAGIPVRLDFNTKTFDVELSNTHAIGGKHVITYGGNLRYNKFILSLATLEDHRTEGGLYAQDEIFFGDKVRLVLGGRVDKFSSIDSAVVSPRAALLLKPTTDSTIRLSYNRAFRAPSAINNNLNTVITNALPLGAINPGYGAAIYRVPTTAVGNPDLREERMDAVEVGYSATINKRVTLSAAYYRTKLTDEIFFTQVSAWTASPAPPGFPALGPFPGSAIWAQFYAAAPQIRFPKEFTYLNLGEVKNQGIELGVDASLTPTWSAYVNYSWQKDPVPNFDITELNLAPNNRFSTGLSYSGPRLFGSASLAYAGEAFWQDVLDARYVGTTRAQTTINGSVGAKWAGGRYMTTLKVVNLTNKQILQHVFADVSRRQIIGELRVNLPK
ncbi:MAG TPA: TonB-dependent receptor [Vicinamibacterales bacterium]|nr:TonB-dependent receptor [Vicinamibacterales bacterium]